MSYGGMWDMSDFKRCSGYKGHWECSDDHPDHMVPREKFNRHSGMSDGLQDKCKKCHRYGVSLEKHPTTGELKRNWKTDHAKSLGGVRNTPEWKSYLDKAEVQWNIDIKNHLLNTERDGEVVLAHMDRMKSEFSQSKPMTRRHTVHVEGEKVDEGWVYVFKCYTSLENHPLVRWVYKIGKTYPDGIGGRISTARGFARVDFIDKFWFEEAEISENEVHKILKPFNLRTLGYNNCGKEMFMCSLEQAVSAINEVKKNWQYQKTSGGLIKNTPIGLQPYPA